MNLKNLFMWVIIVLLSVGLFNLFQNPNGKAELAGINLSRRGETLSIEDFADISNYINSCDE